MIQSKRFNLFASLVLIIGGAFLVFGWVSRQDTRLALVEPAAQADLKLAPFSDKHGVEAPDTLTAEPAEVISDDLLGAAGSAKRQCGLTLSLTPSSTSVAVSGPISYSMTLSNTGKANCKNTSVSIYYSANETFQSSSPTATASNYYWNIGALASGAQKSISISTTSKITDGNDIHTEACATADNSADACADSYVTIGGSGSGSSGSGGSTPSDITEGEDDTDVPVVTPPTPTPPTTTPTIALASGKEYGMWIWVSPLQMTSTYIDTVLAGAVANRINVLYVTIDDYLTIDALPSGTAKDAAKTAYSNALQLLIQRAAQVNIAIDAEAGWRDWAEPGQTYKATAIVNYVLSYNNTHDYRIRALQYDVEPYLLSSYESNKAVVLGNFVALVDRTAIQMNTNSTGFSIVIPHFFDDTQKWTPAITYQGTTTYTFNHLLRIMNTRPNSRIILMSYRNFATGDNSTTAISNTEVSEASVGGHPTKIIVAQETGNVDPGYVTFYGLPKSTYITEANKVISAFTGYSNFGGMAVHYVDPFFQLK